jgi:hypothetical protein
MGAVGGDPVDRVVHPDELQVGLVDDDQHVLRDFRQEGVELRLRDGRPRRVVGRADQHHLGALGDRRGHRVEVVATVREHRHLHRDRSSRGDRDRVGLEGAPREDDLVAGVAEGLHQLVDEAHRAGRDGQVVGGHVEGLGERGVERAAAHVGVAVHRRDPALDCLDDAGQRRVGVLVGGQLVRRHPGSDGRRLARDVRRDLRHVRSGLGGAHEVEVSHQRSGSGGGARGGAPAPARCRCPPPAPRR